MEDAGAGEQGPVDVDRVARRRDERRVARLEQHPHQVDEPLLGAHRRDDLALGVELDPEPAPVQLGALEPEPRDPPRGRVPVVVREGRGVVQLRHGGGGRGEVGVAEAEVDDVRAAAPQLERQLADRAEDVRREVGDAPELHGSAALDRERGAERLLDLAGRPGMAVDLEVVRLLVDRPRDELRHGALLDPGLGRRREADRGEQAAHGADGPRAVGRAVVGLAERVGDALEPVGAVPRESSSVSATTRPIVSPCGRCATLPSAWPSAWSAAQSERFIARPAVRLPHASSRRAAASDPLATAAGRACATRRHASSPNAIESGEEFRTVQPPIAWASASIPECAVGAGGSPCVRTGSTSACWARMLGWPKPTFRSRSVSVRTLAPETSLPVPAVVGQRTSGRVGGTGVRDPPAKSSAEPPWSATRRAAFATSSAEPPPMPTTRSCEASRTRSASSSASAKVGSPGPFT